MKGFWGNGIDQPDDRAHIANNSPRGAQMTQSYPVLPLRDIVVFPNMVVPLFVGRDKSVAALEQAMNASLRA